MSLFSSDLLNCLANISLSNAANVSASIDSKNEEFLNCPVL